MASNYSAYTAHNSQTPQYVYYTPALARHPNSPSYYYAPALPVQAASAGQLHPRSRSFNDLYAGHFAQPGFARGTPGAAAVATPYGSVPAAITASPSMDQLHAAAQPPASQAPAAGAAPAAGQAPAAGAAPAAGQAPGTPPLQAAGAKPLRYRGRMARSKSHSSLIPANAALGVDGPSPVPAGTAAGLPPQHAGTPASRGRRLSSTSLLHRHNNYSASTSSTEGSSSTHSIMSTADTDSLTTQTSLSSTSSLDDEGRVQKINHARRRSVANTPAEKIEKLVEDRADAALGLDSTPATADAAKAPALQAPPSEASIADAPAPKTSADAGDKQPALEPLAAIQGQTEPPSSQGISSGSLPDSLPPAPLVLPSDVANVRASSSSSLAAAEAKATVFEGPNTKNSAAVKTGRAVGDTNDKPSEAGSPRAEDTSSKVELSRAAAVTPGTRMLPKHSQASDASQAREASVKPARSAKESLPTKEAVPTKETVRTKEAAPTRETLTPKDPLPTKENSAGSTEAFAQDATREQQRRTPVDRAAETSSRPLARPKRATAASPSKLVLPSDLQPRSYYQSTTAPEPKAAAVGSGSMRHTRSASWFSDSSSPSFSASSSRLSLVSDVPAARLRTPSAQSDTSVSSSGSASSQAFLQRSYASRQRQSVQSLPPRRPESVATSQSMLSNHPLPRQPSASSSLSEGPAPAPRVKASANAATDVFASVSVPPSPSQGSSRSFGARLKGLFAKEKPTDDVSETASIVSARSSKSSMSVRSTSSFSSFSSRFRRKKAPVPEPIEIPEPPAPAMTRRSVTVPNIQLPPPSPLSRPMLNTKSATPSPTRQEAPRPPSPALTSIGKQVAPNLTAGDIYPGLLRPNDVDTIISSLERTGSFERKPSTSRRSKEQRVPHERVIPVAKPVSPPSSTHRPLKSALKSRASSPDPLRSTRRLAFAKNTLVYNTYSAVEYNRTPEPLPYDLHDRRVVIQLYRELNDLKLSMPVHPSSKHHTQYLFDDRSARAPSS